MLVGMTGTQPQGGAEFMLVGTLHLDLAVKRIAHVAPPAHISPNPRLRASVAARSAALELV